VRDNGLLWTLTAYFVINRLMAGRIEDALNDIEMFTRE
jgi:hypothetical protein